MSALKFYFDTHIPKAVATQLRRRGIEDELIAQLQAHKETKNDSAP